MITIGIVTRIDKTENNDVYVCNKKIVDYLISKNVRIIPLITYDISLVSMCDGFILHGGDFKTIDFLIIKYAYERNLPLLGICLGMQSIGEYFGGKIVKAFNHYSKDMYVHDMIIDRSSKLFEILKIENMQVNSRHKDKLIDTNLKVSAYSSDGVIEAVEDGSKKFFIGVQWHPESLITYNVLAKKLLDSFIKSCKEDKS